MQSFTRKLLLLAGLVALVAPLIGTVAHSTPCHGKDSAVTVGVGALPTGGGAPLSTGLSFDAPTRL